MALKRTVEPTELPLTLDEAKAHLRVTAATEDADIMAYLRGVVDILDGPAGILNRALITQTLEYKINDFPGRAFDLPLAPMQSVTSVVYLDADGNSQTLSTSIYRVLNANTPMRKGRIEREEDQTWPTVQDVEQAVTITYVAGYGARNAVPWHIRQLIRVMLKEAYDNREPMSAAALERRPAYQGLLSQAVYPAVA